MVEEHWTKGQKMGSYLDFVTVSCANLDKSAFLEEARQKSITLISSLIILNTYYNSQWKAI